MTYPEDMEGWPFFSGYSQHSGVYFEGPVFRAAPTYSPIRQGLFLCQLADAADD